MKKPIDVFPQVRIARVDAMFRFVSKWIPQIYVLRVAGQILAPPTDVHEVSLYH